MSEKITLEPSEEMRALTSKVDMYLSKNRYEVAEDDPHIELKN